MVLINGKVISQNILNTLADKVKELKKKNIEPGLGIILVGKKEDSVSYVKMKTRVCMEIGIKTIDIKLSENIVEEKIIEEIEKLNTDSTIHGILVQLPLPKHINKDKVLNMIDIKKDVDGFHPYNMGNLAINRLNNCIIPCTPEGCIKLLDSYNIEIEGKHVVVIGKSNVVGLPLSLLFMHREATVSVCHYKTQNIKTITKLADILVVACGQPKMINREYIKEGCIIVDIGINSIEDKTKKSGYKLVGDVDIDDVKEICSAITPVPGGIGPMTIAMLMSHTIKAAY